VVLNFKKAIFAYVLLASASCTKDYTPKILFEVKNSYFIPSDSFVFRNYSGKDPKALVYRENEIWRFEIATTSSRLILIT